VGYVDNPRLVTLVEWLNEWLHPQKGLIIKRVLLYNLQNVYSKFN